MSGMDGWRLVVRRVGITTPQARVTMFVDRVPEEGERMWVVGDGFDPSDARHRVLSRSYVLPLDEPAYVFLRVAE